MDNLGVLGNKYSLWTHMYRLLVKTDLTGISVNVFHL